MIMSLKQMKLNHNIYIDFYDVTAGKMCRITHNCVAGVGRHRFVFLVSLQKAREENTCARGACPRNSSLRPHKSGA